MVIGVCRVSLAIPENASIKDKRSVVRRIISRVRKTFNVAIAEVEDMDDWYTATLGFAVVSNDSRVANSVADKIIAFIQGLFLAEIEHYDFEIIHF